MNFLLLGAGRRVSFIQHLMSNNVNVYCYEYEEDTAASKVCKSFKGHKWGSSKIVEHISSIIEENNIDCIIPLQDEAILFLSQNKKNLKTFCLCPNAYSSKIAFDKKEFEIFIKNNFNSLYPDSEEIFPKFAKPRFGNGSKGICVLRDKNELSKINTENFVIQKFIEGGEEYSVDCFFSNGFLIDCVPRIRLRVANGEVLNSQTFESKFLHQTCRDIGEIIEYDGPACIQFIKDKKTEKIYIMEINARFGGGCILSLKSGFNMIKCIKEKIEGKNFSHIKGSWKKNLLMKRVNTEFYFEK